jgi:hypothetical protein
MFRPRYLLVLAALAAVIVGCRRARREAPTPVSTPPSLFAGDAGGSTRVLWWVSREPALGPHFTAVDGQGALLEPGGRLHWVSAPNGDAVVRTASTPCRYDASRHALLWTVAPRIALDGQGHACCIHDGDDAAPAGAYCADLRAPAPRWQRARLQGVPIGAGSGEGAIALFATDLWCTRDGGASIAVTHRGDREQPFTAASCAGDGQLAVAVAGTRAPGSVRQQTVRVSRAGGSLALLPEAPRGEPIDVRARRDGSLEVLLTTSEGPQLLSRDAQGHLTVHPLEQPVGAGLGAWGAQTLVVSGGALHAFGAQGERSRSIEGQGSVHVALATRVGRSLIGIARTGGFAVLAED